MVNLRAAVPVVVREGGASYYHPRLLEIRGRAVSGVYVILAASGREVLYVGESHSGRLYDTLTRHFRAWRPKRWDSGGGRRGGTTYDRARCLVAWAVTAPERAVDLQFAEIARLDPRDNEIVPADLPV